MKSTDLEGASVRASSRTPSMVSSTASTARGMPCSWSRPFRISVTEFARQLHLAGDAGPVLDRVLGDQPGVVGRAAGDDVDLVDFAQVLNGESHLVELEGLPVLGQPAPQRVGDRPRLLGDLLEHEVVVAALLGGGGVPVDMKVLALRGVPGKIGDLDEIRRDQDDLVLAQL